MIETGPVTELGTWFNVLVFFSVVYLINGLFEMLRTYGERREMRKEQQNPHEAETVIKVHKSEER